MVLSTCGSHRWRIATDVYVGNDASNGAWIRWQQQISVAVVAGGWLQKKASDGEEQMAVNVECGDIVWEWDSKLQELLCLCTLLPWEHKSGNNIELYDTSSLVSRYGTSQCRTQSNTYYLTVRLFFGTSLHTTSDNNQTRPHHTAQPTWQTTSPWWWSQSPLQWCGFDESIPLKGQTAFHIFFPRPMLNSCNWFIKLMKILASLY